MKGIRDILRKDGITGKEALNVIVVTFLLQKLESTNPGLKVKDNYKLSGEYYEEHKQIFRDALIHKLSSPFELNEYITGGLDLYVQREPYVFEEFPNYMDGWRLYKLASDGNFKGIFNDLYDFVKTVKYPSRLSSKKLWDSVKEVFTTSAGGSTAGGSGDGAGKIYMEIVKDFLSESKDLGQFFTPDCVVKVCVDFALLGGREIGRVLDPTCGTGGFLVEALKHNPKYLYGCELDQATHTIALANIAVHDPMFSNYEIKRQNFLTHDIESVFEGEKFDTLLANPPFGMKGMEFPENIAWFPFPTGSATIMFLQKMISHLKVGGRGCVVLPSGSELNGKGIFQEIRQAFLMNMRLNCVVTIPSGTFTSTSISTLLICFDKFRELREGIEYMSKPEYYHTKDVVFYTLNSSLVDGSLSCSCSQAEDIPPSVTLMEMAEKNFSFIPSDYKKITQKVSSTFPMYKLGDLVELKSGKAITKKELKDGPYLVIGGGTGPMGKHNEYNIEANTIIISKIGTVGHISRYGERIYLSNNGNSVILKVQLNNDYLYFILKYIFGNIIKEFKSGVAQPYLDVNKFYNIEIPYPPLEIQDFIARESLELETKIKDLERLSVGLLKDMKIYMANALYKDGYLGFMSHIMAPRDNIGVYRMGDLVEMKKGKRLTKANSITGEYPILSGGLEPMGTHNVFNVGADEILMTTEGSVGNVFKLTTPAYITDHCTHFTSKYANKDYMYFLMKYLLNDEIKSMKTGLAQPRLNVDMFNNLQVPVPSPELQVLISNKMLSLEKGLKIINNNIKIMKHSLSSMIEQFLYHTSEISDSRQEPLEDVSLDDDIPE